MKRIRPPKPDLEEIMPILLGVWRRFNKEPGPQDCLQTREFRRMVAAIQKLNAKSPEELTDFSDTDTLSAYLLYHWVIHYQEGLSIFGELPHTPKRVLDICSGPGAFAFAALRHGAREVISTDMNLKALNLGAEICGRYGLPLTIREWNCRKKAIPFQETFDLIILGHCLEELFPSSEHNSKELQIDFLNSLLKKLTPNGFLVLVESSQKNSNQKILQIRDKLVESGVPVQAPCVWQGSCPVAHLSDSPCYAQRELEKSFLTKEFQRAANINLGSLKMSYMIFRSPLSTWPQLPEQPLYRVISPPVDSYHGKGFYLCGTDGKKKLESRIKDLPLKARAFEYLRRGELIAIENGFCQNNAIDLTAESSVQVVAPCGKPLETS